MPFEEEHFSFNSREKEKKNIKRFLHSFFSFFTLTYLANVKEKKNKLP
jgi:hypothetical protein